MSTSQMNILRDQFPLIYFIFILCITSSGIVAGSDESNANATKVYEIARAPQMSKKALAIVWQPYLDYLSQETGYHFKLKLFDNRTEFEKDMLKGVSDMYFMNPYYAMLAHENKGYIPIVRSNAKKLTGILVVRKDSKIKSLSQLDNKAVAFPWPNAFGASLYMRALLKEQEKIKIDVQYVQTHDNVYRSVLNGKTSAGGGVNRTFKSEPESVRSQLKILYTTPGVAPHPLTAHPRVPKKVRNAILKATLKLATHDKGKKMLKKLKLSKPRQADFDKDYSLLKDLNLSNYATIEGAK